MLLWASGGIIEKVCKIMENAKCRNVQLGFCYICMISGLEYEEMPSEYLLMFTLTLS